MVCIRKRVKKKTVGIIGAGPSGLVSAKYSLEAGLEPTVFEKTSDIAGIWSMNTGLVWESMHTNLSRFSCMFSDLPWEKSNKDFPSKREMYEYLCRYADKFSLRNIIQLQSHVRNVRELENGKWAVTYVQGGTETIHEFDSIIVACGIFSSSFIPRIPGLERFQGEKQHSSDYKNAAQFQGKHVAVVGSSFSGTEIASEISTQADTLHHIFKTPHWVLARNIPVDPSKPDSPLWPLDLLFYSRASRTNSAENKFKTAEANRKSHTYMSSICSQQGNLSQNLRIPEAEWGGPSQVTISDTYLEAVREQKILLKKGAIKVFDDSGILFEDGTHINVDSVVFCTGYRLDLSFLDESVQKKLEFVAEDSLQPLVLYKCTFNPAVPNLAFVGVYRGPYFSVMELQAKWASAVFSGKIAAPEMGSCELALGEERSIRTTLPRPQFPHADYVGLADSIAEEIRCLPNFETLKESHPQLYQRLSRGPVVPAHYQCVRDGQLIQDPQILSGFEAQLEEIAQFLEARSKIAVAPLAGEVETLIFSADNETGVENEGTPDFASRQHQKLS